MRVSVCGLQAFSRSNQINIRALITRIGFWGTWYYSYNKDKY